MTLQVADRIKESSTTTGTGTFTLAGAQTGYQTFTSSITTGNTTYYCIQNQAVPSEWEVGIGTLATSSTLARTTIITSSTGSAVSFSAGTKDVFVTMPASQLPGCNGLLMATNGLLVSQVATTGGLNVDVGSCSDSTGTKPIILTSAASLGQAVFGLGGIDRKLLSGTTSYTSGSVNMTGVSTFYTTEFGTRAMTGTITSSTTAVTGTGTKFLTEIAVNDLIGTAAKGYYRVTTIATNTSLTITSAPASAFSGQTPNCIETPTISPAGISAQRIATITSDTALTITANAVGTATNQTTYTGSMYFEPTNNCYNYVFILTDGVTTGVTLSTQRTKPYLAATYPYYKRLTALVYSTGNVIIPFRQQGGARRETHLFLANAASNSRVLSNGGAGTMTTVACNVIIPPTATLMYVRGVHLGASAIAYIRPSNLLGTPTTAPNAHVWLTPASGYCDKDVYAFTDGAQQIDYTTTVTGFYLDVMGFVEDL